MKFRDEFSFSLFQWLFILQRQVQSAEPALFFSNTLGSQSPGEKKASLNMWLIYHTEERDEQRRGACVCLCVIKGYHRSNSETEGDRRWKTSNIVTAQTVTLCVFSLFLAPLLRRCVYSTVYVCVCVHVGVSNSA